MFKRLSISYKISLIAFIGIIGFSIYQGVNFRLSLEIRDRLDYIISEEFPVLRFSNYLQINFNELDKLYQAALAESDIDTLLEANQKADDIEAEFSQIESRYQINHTLFYELSALLKKYRQGTSLHTRHVIENRLTYDEVIDGYTEIGLVREQLLEMQAQFIENRYRSFADNLDIMEKDELFIIQFGLILGALLLIILVVVSAVIIRSITSAFRSGVDFAHSIAAGNLNANLHTDAQDETGQLITSLNAMRKVLKKQSLDNQVREHEQLFIAGLNDAMRGDPRVQNLAEKVCRFLLQSIPSINNLAFYARVDEENFVVLDVQGRDESLSLNNVFEDSLSTLEGRTAEALGANALLEFDGVTPLNEHYFEHISTEQLNSLPRYWAYFPITLDSDAKALLVIGCDEGIGAENKHLLEQANNALAIAITSARARKKVANMLEQTQIQAKELTAQQRELALINDKLEDKTTDLDKQKTEILEQNILLEASQEALLEKSTALEASGRYKSQFLSTMSHELRTPLNSILLLSEALLENRESNLSEKQVRHADVIHHAGDELLSLINDILDLSKVEEGKMDIIIDAISPEDFVHRLKTQSEVLAQDKQLDFNVQFSDDLPEFIYTDEHRLYQILKNFVSNAFKFTEHGGINVIVSMLAAGELPSGAVAKEGESFICFTVKDSGVGIAPDKQKIVFEAFKQADGTTSRKFGGSGLGLTISRELALLLGGEVALHSRGLGHGSSFMVYVPQGHESHITTDVSSASELNAYPVQENVSLPLLEQAPMPSRLPVDAIVFLSTNAAWHNMVREKSELSPIKLNTIETVVELEQYMSRKLPSAFVVDCDSTDLIEALCRENITVPVFAVGDSLSAQFKSEIEVLHWLDLHNLNHIIERSLKGADKPLARVLFVEDNPVFHEVIRSVFSKLGLSVDLVDDAVSAVNALYEKTYELIVVDLNLPDFSGEQVMQVARSMPALSGKNIVLFTAEDLQEKHKKQLLQIADEVIFKSPQAIYELANKAQLLINQSSDANGKRVHASNTNAAYQAGMLQGAKVLLVDDDERNLYSLGSALEAEGITVYSVGSGIEALEVLARGDRVDLILLDIMMPEIDGYEVLNRIRSNPDWSFYPVIALTAKAMLGDKQRCLDAGATDYLSKPVSMQTLLDKMMVYIG